MPGEPLILRDADWMPEALKIGRPRSASVAASIAAAAHAAAPAPPRPQRLRLLPSGWSSSAAPPMRKA